MAGSIREALMEAYDAVETAEETGEPIAPRTLEPIVDEPKELPSLESSDTNIDEPLPEPEVKVAPKSTPKPAPKPAPEKRPLANAKAAQAADVTPVVPKHKAPQSWRPEVRTHWEKLPIEVQAEIAKREGEVSRGLAEAAVSRKFHSEFSNVIRPFETILVASGVKNPLDAVRNLMTTAATMQTGTQAQKANTVANIIKAYGVDIATLDAVLAGRKPPPGQQPTEELSNIVRRELQPVREFMTRQEQQVAYQQQQLSMEADNTITAFADDPKNKYYDDLREDMADLLDMAAKRGRLMTMQEAYDRAAYSHPEISKLVAKDKAAEAAAKSRGNVDRARRASVSQSQGTPAAVGKSAAKPVGVRAAISQAFDDLSA